MFDRLVFIALIVIITGLLNFVVPHTSLTLMQLTSIVGGLLLAYIAINSKSLRRIIKAYAFKECIFVLFFWPVLTSVYSEEVYLRTLGIHVYLLLILLASSILTVKNELNKSSQLAYLSMVITIFGAFLSMIAPSVFIDAAEIASTFLDNEGRAYGFLLQSNQLAISLNFMFACSLFYIRGRGSVIATISLVFFTIAIMLTGSRMGVIAFILVVLNAYVDFRHLFSFRFLLKFLILIPLLIAVLVGLQAWISSEASYDSRRESLASRFDAILNFEFSSTGSVSSDGSVQERLFAQEAYWDLVKSAPIVGHGFSSQDVKLENRELLVSAHSDALATAMQYGLLYPIVLLACFMKVFRSSKREYLSPVLSKSVRTIALISMPIFVLSGGLLDCRTFYMGLGLIFGLYAKENNADPTFKMNYFG